MDERQLSPGLQDASGDRQHETQRRRPFWAVTVTSAFPPGAAAFCTRAAVDGGVLLFARVRLPAPACVRGVSSPTTKSRHGESKRPGTVSPEGGERGRARFPAAREHGLLVNGTGGETVQSALDECAENRDYKRCTRQHRRRTFFSRWRNCGARSWVCQSNHTVSGCMRWRCSSRLRRQRVEVAQTYRHGQRNPQDIHKLSAVLIRSKSAPELRIT